MSVNLGLPLVNQLVGGANYRAPTDGKSDENTNYNCGEAVFCSIVSHFGGPSLSPDAVHDIVSGQGTANVPSDMSQYSGLAAQYGLAITRVAGDAATLLARASAELAAGHPVVILIPSMWGQEPPPPQGVGSLHFVGLEADSGSGTLTAMNPWGGFSQTESYAWWQERIRDGAIWIFSKEEAQQVSIVIEKDSAGTITGAHNQDNSGVHVGAGFAASIASVGLTSAEILLAESTIATPSGTIAYCVVSGPGDASRGRYVGTWLPNDLHFDDRAEVAQVLVALKRSADAQSARAGQLQQQLSAAQAQDTADKAAAAAAQAADATDKAAAEAAQSDLATAEQTIQQLEAQLAGAGQNDTATAAIAALKAALGLS